MERRAGIEPAYDGWKPSALPLGQRRIGAGDGNRIRRILLGFRQGVLRHLEHLGAALVGYVLDDEVL